MVLSVSLSLLYACLTLTHTSASPLSVLVNEGDPIQITLDGLDLELEWTGTNLRMDAE